MTDHARHIDPHLASQKCTPAEQEVVRLVNKQLPWTTIVALTGRSRGVVRREWNEANRKVNGGYVPAVESRPTTEEKLAPGYVKPPTKGEKDRAMRATDPDWQATRRGIPITGKPKLRGFRRPELPPR